MAKKGVAKVIGMISLVGAGPGDIELLTVKGKRRLQEADVVVYDRLVNRELLSLVNEDCELIYVGKEPQFHPVPQEKISEILIEKAKDNKKIVRLKGGDPYVFGRGGEEGAAVLSEGIPFEVVPGITSAIGGLAYAGIPITHRYVAGSFHVITAHRGEEGLAINWQALGSLTGTLVFLMGVSELSTICNELQRVGKNPETSVAVVHWATRSKQKTVVGNLKTITEEVERKKITSPSLIVVGDVVNLRETLNIFETKPLFGKEILVPRTSHKRLAYRLIDEGASIVSYPSAIRKGCSWEMPAKMADNLVFTDGESWDSFILEFKKMSCDIRHLDAKISGIGHHTCEKIKAYGIQLEQELIEKSQLVRDENMMVFGSSRDLNWVSEINAHFIKTHDLVYKGQKHDDLNSITAICLPHSQAAYDLLANYTLAELADIPIFVLGNQTAAVIDNLGLQVILSKEATFDSLITKLEEEL
ncbi:uroporphyrinogen-III C-methyltransferase [Vagococcus fessus]|uniref:Uroporphyrinogen-III C-methyltransferase n=1 Tax=Vagococcus fessus TaxID=120370 RepID=A0A430ACZ8_9ENTE|nr:uroporphyrinogen-III C-methyltransferase [Vagococcus fessus]RSU05097.1 uroporphyrinogen-III C-methyltransferase [Vagococcus fessus]